MNTQHAKKMLAIFTVILIVSTGLCASNFAAYSYYDTHPASSGNDFWLIPVGFLELAGMVAEVIGCIAYTIIWVIGALRDRRHPTAKDYR